MDDFGERLRQARERRGISLRQIAASTKISAAALDALERNDISKMPGGIFSRAFVKSYAAEVGLDPEETVREFVNRFDQVQPPTAQSVTVTIPAEEAEFEHRKRLAARVLIATIIGIPALALILYFTTRGRSTHSLRTEHLPAAVSPPAHDTIPPATTVGDAGQATGSAAPVAPVPSVAVADAPAAAVMLDLHPTGDCWVSLTVDGRKLFARIMHAGEREPHVVHREAVVEVGDAGAFAFSVDGREGKPLGDRGQLKTLKLTPASATQLLR